MYDLLALSMCLLCYKRLGIRGSKATVVAGHELCIHMSGTYTEQAFKELM